MKRKLIKLLIAGLIITLTIISSCTYAIYNRNKSSQAVNVNTTQQVEQQMRIVSSDIVVKKLNQENSMNVLSGVATVEKTFTNMNITDQDVSFKWMKDWLNKSKSKEITPVSTFKFYFSYDLKNLNTTCKDNKVHISLSQNRLSLNSIELLETKSTERVGWLESTFTTNEINSINARVQKESKNTIQSTKKYRDEAMESLQKNIKDLLSGVVDSTKIVFDIPTYDVVQNTDVKILS